MKKRMARVGKSLLAMALGSIMVGGAIGMGAKNGIAISAATDTGKAEAYVDNTDWSAVFHDLLTGDVTYNPDLRLDGLDGNWPEPGEAGFIDNGYTEGKVYQGARFQPQLFSESSTGAFNGYYETWAKQEINLDGGAKSNYIGYVGEKMVDLHFSDVLGRSVLYKTQDDYIESFPMKSRAGAGWYGVLNGTEFKPGETSPMQMFGVPEGNTTYPRGVICFYESGSNKPFTGNLLTDENKVPYMVASDGKKCFYGSIIYKNPGRMNYDMASFSVNVTDGTAPEMGVAYEYSTARLDTDVEGLAETVKFMGGIDCNSSFEDILGVYGRPDMAAYNYIVDEEPAAYAGWHSILGYLDTNSKYILRFELVNNKLVRASVMDTGYYKEVAKENAQYLMKNHYNEYLGQFVADAKAKLMQLSAANKLGGTIEFEYDATAPKADIDRLTQQAMNFISAYEYVNKDRVLNKLTINGMEYTAKAEDVDEMELASYPPYSNMENAEQRLTAVRLRLEQWKNHDFSTENDASCTVGVSGGTTSEGNTEGGTTGTESGTGDTQG